jgi:hypothetical protein
MRNAMWGIAALVLGGCPSPPGVSDLGGASSTLTASTGIAPGVYVGEATGTTTCETAVTGEHNVYDSSMGTSFELTADGRVFVDGVEMYEGAVMAGADIVMYVTGVSISSTQILVNLTSGSSLYEGYDSYMVTRVDDSAVELEYRTHAFGGVLGTCEGVSVGTLRK